MAWRENAHFGNTRIDKLMSVAFSIGTEATNAITTALTFTDAVDGASMSQAMSFYFYLSSDAAGQVPEAGTDCAVTAGTDGAVILSGGDSSIDGMLITETTGEMDFIITDTGVDTYYINIVMPDGRIETSGAVTFA